MVNNPSLISFFLAFRSYSLFMLVNSFVYFCLIVFDCFLLDLEETKADVI